MARDLPLTISEELEIRSITVQDTIKLRHTVLWPDRPVSYVLLPEDDTGHHFGAFNASTDAPELIGVISLFREPIPPAESADNSVDEAICAARFRKFAVDPAYQGQGVGTRLLEEVFSVASSELKFSTIWCDARVAVADWYQKRGMSSFGANFDKGGLEYIRMRKDIAVSFKNCTD